MAPTDSNKAPDPKLSKLVTIGPYIYHTNLHLMTRCTISSGMTVMMALPLSAQITVTNSVFPAPGDTLHYAFGNQPDAITTVFTPPGGNQTWDLSGLQSTELWEQVFSAASTGQGFAQFPEANMFYRPYGGDTNLEDYISITPTEVNSIGSFGADPLGIGMDMAIRWSPMITLDRAPVNFFDIYQESSGILHPFLPGDMPPGMVDQLPVQPDSFRIRETISRLDVVDAWGTMVIPGGGFPVLREKRTEYVELRLDAKVPPLGWIDITDVAITTWGVQTLGVDTLTSFRYVNDQSKETIAICWLNPDQNSVVGVQYKVAELSTAVRPGRAVEAAVRAFPTPATDHLFVQAQGAVPGALQLVITDAMGRPVLVERHQVNASGRSTVELAVHGLQAGIYQGTIVQSDGRAMSFRFVKQ